MPTAVVTGANSGIGHAFANLLINEGYKVYALDKDQGQGLAALSGKATTGILDVSSIESILKFKADIQDETIDLLLNIAGIAFSPAKDGLETTNVDILQQTFAVNTFGPLLVTQTLLPNLLKSSNPKLGIVSSRVGSVGDNSTGGNYAYRASKAAVNSIGKSLAVELKDRGVVVTILHPGIVKSNIFQSKVDFPPDAVEPNEAARKLWDNIVSQKGIQDTGKFWHREGYELPW
ncbi:hypothetical protein PV10_03481 [Exophiala mesophila]|uniref:NAD(P)-binding protein n=1 Tax=Exophiala mesophila TaxID=212818 RepID=A0A0D1X282_EXOME|nr:uncharacterized protein PV10_03481 [Exophiala mesophila]KIV95880.1 hypothetical protein PV10_03481 [Exophiala mesophila]